MINWHRMMNGLRRLSLSALLLMSWFAASQITPAEHVFQVPRAELDKALHDLHVSSPGRLPTLEGFVGADVPSLEKYKQAYYQYKLEFRPVGSGATLLRVSARVTAWYAGGGTTQPGYRELPSNGRLETDLFERLEEALQQNSSHAERQASPSTSTAENAGGADRAPATSGHTPPAATPPFHPFPPLEPPSTRSSLQPPTAQELAHQKQVQQLTEQAANLEEILRNLAHPNDLAAVRKTGTAIFTKPADDGELLFRADAEDEFKVLDESGDWVHVQVSGISRGWIRRSELEMPGETNTAAGLVSKPTPAAAGPALREETSLFPGDWPALRGRMVRIVWARPESVAPSETARWPLARSLFLDTYSRISRDNARVEGVVIVIDAADGGMIAATANSLRRWNTGTISDAAFRKECWADPPEAIGDTVRRNATGKPQTE